MASEDVPVKVDQFTSPEEGVRTTEVPIVKAMRDLEKKERRKRTRRLILLWVFVIVVFVAVGLGLFFRPCRVALSTKFDLASSREESWLLF